MSIIEYRQHNQLVAYRLQKKIANRLVFQRYYFFSQYGSKHAAMRKAKQDEKELQERYYIENLKLFTDDGHIIGLRLAYECRESYTQPIPYLKLQSVHNKKRLYRCWSLNANDWEAAFEEAIKLLIDHKHIALTFEIAMMIEEAKPKYNHTRLSNWN